MPFPWVSRGRFEDAQQQIVEMKEERAKLYDRIAVLSGQQTLFAPAPLPPPPAVVAAEVREDDEAPVGRKLTRRELIERAELAAREKKMGPIAAFAVGGKHA